MAFIITTFKTLRNHWKKSTFATIVLTYGANSTKNYFETQELMRIYCNKAAEYGNQPIPVNINPRNITVILNPSANKRKCSDEFEKYCAPLLHLAGICVDVIKTESEGHAKNLIDKLSNTEAVVVAGGDGTVSEVVTGLLRRTDEKTSGLVPIGVLPLGKNNSVASFLFPGGNKLARIKSLADATMAVIEEVTKPIDVMKIEVINQDSETNKPVYALGAIKWGAYRDAEVQKDKYWYFGGLRKYATYIVGGLKSSLTWDCEAVLQFSPPCEGCSNCYKFEQKEEPKKWFHKLMTSNEKVDMKYLRTINPDCGQIRETNIKTTDVALLTTNVIEEQTEESTPRLQLQIGPRKVDYVDFVKEGWKSENGKKRKVEQVIEARTIEILPNVKSDDKWFSIDNENYEVKPVKITLLPKVINVFCKREQVQ